MAMMQNTARWLFSSPEPWNQTFLCHFWEGFGYKILIEMTPFWILYWVSCNWVLPPVGRPSWETVAICHWSDKFQHLKPSPQGFGLCFTTAYHTVVVGRLWHNLGLRKFCLFRRSIIWALCRGFLKTSRKWNMQGYCLQKPTFTSYGSFMSHERLLAAVYLSFCSRRANEVGGPWKKINDDHN